MEHEVLKIPRPDLVIYLSVPVEISIELLQTKKRDVVEQDRTYLEQSARTADWLATRKKTWRIINCVEGGKMRPPEAIHEDIWREIQDAL
jgi:dTMP kinase